MNVVFLQESKVYVVSLLQLLIKPARSRFLCPYSKKKRLCLG